MAIPDRPVVMPLDPKKMMSQLMTRHHFSIKMLAEELQVSVRTLYRFQEGQHVNPHVLAKIITLYCRLELNFT